MSLMSQVESKGRDQGCHSVWIGIFSPPSKIIKGNRYDVFGELQNSSEQMPHHIGAGF